MKQAWVGVVFVFFLSAGFAQGVKPVVSLYPGTKFIQEIFFIKGDDANFKEGNYYSFYNGYLEDTKWTGGKIDPDNIKGIKTKGYYHDNLKDSVWTIYAEPVAEVKGGESKINKPNEIREEGWYLVDKKAGIWYTILEGGRVQKRYDFDEQKELEPVFRSKFIYPRKAKDAGVQGLVGVKIIYKNCRVSRYEIVKDIGYGCADAFIKSLKETEKLKSKYGVNPIDCTKKDEVVTARFER